MAHRARPCTARGAVQHRTGVHRPSGNNQAMLELIANRAMHAVTMNFGQVATISDLHDF